MQAPRTWPAANEVNRTEADEVDDGGRRISCSKCLRRSFATVSVGNARHLAADNVPGVVSFSTAGTDDDAGHIVSGEVASITNRDSGKTPPETYETRTKSLMR
jgi:hypothetical protein